MAEVESPVMVVTTVAMATIKQERAVKGSRAALLHNRQRYIRQTDRQTDPSHTNHLNTFNTQTEGGTSAHVTLP